MLIKIHSQDSSRVNHVDFDSLKDGGDGAQPTSLAGYDNAWSSTMIGPDGTEYHVTFAFSDDETDEAGEHADNLPWDGDHVARIEVA